MKKFCTILLLFITTAAFAQDHKQVDSLEFCTVKYKVPNGGIAKYSNEIKGNDYRMIWSYLDSALFKTIPEQFIRQLGVQFKEFTCLPAPVYLLNKPVTGYKISFKKDHELYHQIIAYGIVNGQQVLVQLSLNTEVKTNKDIPEFPRQILSLAD